MRSMLHQRVRSSAKAPEPLIERRREVLTRAVVDGLEQLNAHMEQLPEGLQKDAAMAAVACFAMRIADALQTLHVVEDPTAARGE
jgi:hypothetical protein